MKFRITFKDPDGVYDSMQFEALRGTDEMEDWELQCLKEARIENMHTGIADWVRYGEYITVEFDTKENTARVIKHNES